MARAGRGCSWKNIWARNSLHQPLLSPFSRISMLPPPQTTLISPFPSSYFLHKTPQKSGTDPRCPSPASCKVSHSLDCDPSICEVAWRDVLGDFISLVGAGAGNALLLPLEGPSWGYIALRRFLGFPHSVPPRVWRWATEGLMPPGIVSMSRFYLGSPSYLFLLVHLCVCGDDLPPHIYISTFFKCHHSL